MLKQMVRRASRWSAASAGGLLCSPGMHAWPSPAGRVGGRMRQGTAPSRGTSPIPRVDSENDTSRALALLNHAQRRGEFQLKDP